MNWFHWIALSNVSVSLPEYAFPVWNMLLLKRVWVDYICMNFWKSGWESSRQRLSGGKGNFNKNDCNMWSQVCHWSIRTSEPIQHLNLPPPLLTRHTSTSAPSVSLSLLFSTHRQTIVSIHIAIHPRPQKTTLNEGRQACSCGSLEFRSSIACASTTVVCVGDFCDLLETFSVINTDLVRTSSPHRD